MPVILNRNGTTQTDYINHATQHEWWKSDVKGMSNNDILRNFKNRAVCPKCEAWAYRDKGWRDGGYARCPKCGWSGKTITIDEYITHQLYK